MDVIDAEIAELEAKRAAGIVHADHDTLARMVDEDYVHIDADGSIRDKAGYLAAVCQQAGRYVEYRVTENHISHVGDLAIVRGSFENAFQANDGSMRRKAARHVRLYRLHADGWRNIYHQGTAIASPEVTGPAPAEREVTS
ncbi:MAG: nuclear transport factor 2 family protein [Novosphingobium sp.]